MSSSPSIEVLDDHGWIDVDLELGKRWVGGTLRLVPGKEGTQAKDLPLERWYREIRIRRVGEGPSEVQKHIIARDILGAGLR